MALLKYASVALSFTSTVLSQTVTITRDIPPREHDCIEDCIWRPYNRRVDVGDVLECAPPYQESCWCPSEDARAEIVSRHFDACATESCSRGDLTQDIDKMRAHYATYCVEKGYTVDLMEQWYSALETVAITTTTTEAETTTATTTTATTSGEDTQTEDAEASTSGPTATAATTTTTSDNTAAAPTETDPNRNPDGLPKMDFGDEEEGALMTGPSLVLLGLASFIALGQFL